MIESNYSKHKDQSPRDTVERIKGILDSIGITTELFWTSRQFGGTCSNRVNIAGTSLGTNGKGTNEEYATASGYAELMERLQNKAAGRRIQIGDTFARLGFYEHPDERLVSAEELVARHDPVMDGWLEGWGCTGDDEKVALVRELSRIQYRRDDGMVAEVPFADLSAGCVRWLSPALYSQLCSSNGMSAGNTMEECLVQGLSEIFERYVRVQVLEGKATCPVIPREELDAWSVGELIRRIERSGRYRVRVMDGSLGRGYPVAITAITDLRRGSFGVNCGAHPSMAVAVERTLTEAFQGRTIELFTGINQLAPADEAASRANRRSVMRNGVGVYPTDFFVKEPDWEYRPWAPSDHEGNADLLRGMVALLERDGLSLLVRDSSHLGFPSCHIIVPGMSEVTTPTPEGLAAIRVRADLSKALEHFPQVTQDEEEAILTAERLSSSLSLVRFERPLKIIKAQPACLFSYLHLARGEFGEAVGGFEAIARHAGEPASLYWQAMAQYARWRSWGEDRARALELVRTMYPPAFARRVEADTAGDDLLATQYPQMNCYDCEHCALGAAGGCLGLQDREAFRKLDAALARSQVSQDALLRHLQEVLGVREG